MGFLRVIYRGTHAAVTVHALMIGTSRVDKLTMGRG
jgi:hypothetical protein